MQFETIPHPSPTTDADRAAAIADPGFGTVFTDHMVVIDYDEAKGGWHAASIGPRQPIALDPAASVLHYAQEIFEGMKAFTHEDGGLALFRPQANAARFNASARRMAMPEIPEDLFLEAVRMLVAKDADWMPPVEGGSLYIRPFMFASEAFLFGREASGLETEDVALARHILTVPINPEFGSLNLAQAVILAAYEWSRIGREQAENTGPLVQPTAEEELLPPAPQDDLEGLIAHFEKLLAPRGYFFPESRREATARTLRSVLTKPGWNHLEVRTLRGILSTLERPERTSD